MYRRSRVRRLLGLDDSDALESSSKSPTPQGPLRVQEPTSQGSTNILVPFAGEQLFSSLVEQGMWRDVTLDMIPGQFSEFPVASGGSGDIWKGKLHDGSDVAIKLRRFTLRNDSFETKNMKRFARELYNWSKLNHDNIQRLIGVIMFRGRLGVVSPWMENGNLRVYINRNPSTDRYQLSIQVTRGVQYLHGLDFVHGDIKASSVLVDGSGVAKLASFDNVPASGPNAFSWEVVPSRGYSVRWMAPELLDEMSPGNKRTDVYALGMTILEIITGDAPYSQAQLDVHVILKVSRGILPNRTDHFGGRTGDQVWKTLVRCWNRDPADRPTADDVVTSLTRINARRQTRPDDPAERGCRDLTSDVNWTTISGYPVASGGRTDIFHAVLTDGTAVSIKVWRLTHEADESGTQYAARVLHNWSKLNHTNVHKLLGMVMFQGRLGLVSQWMENGNLRGYIHRNSGVDRYQLCIDVATGVEYLHRQNMVHGDLNCANILVSPEGVPKLAGFGLSMTSDNAVMFPESGMPGGTLRWMAPELLLGSSNQSSKVTDVYSLGMTLYEIITGAIPWAQLRSDMHVFHQLIQQAHPEKTEHFDRDAKTGGLWMLLLKCWNYDPDARPTVHQVIDALYDLDNETVPTGSSFF